MSKIKVLIELFIEDVDEDEFIEIGIENYIEMLLEEDGLDCFIINEDYNIIDIELI